MNRRKFLKLLVGLLAALPFVKREIPKQPRLSPWSNTEVITTISLDDYANQIGDEQLQWLTGMSHKQFEEAKAEWLYPGLDHIINTGIE